MVHLYKRVHLDETVTKQRYCIWQPEATFSTISNEEQMDLDTFISEKLEIIEKLEPVFEIKSLVAAKYPF